MKANQILSQGNKYLFKVKVKNNIYNSIEALSF